jgi:hypothetical protein
MKFWLIRYIRMGIIPAKIGSIYQVISEEEDLLTFFFA